MLSEILRLDSLIADCLTETQKLKLNIVILEQYEYAAEIRSFEKQFEKIREILSTFPYYSIPSKGLTRNGTIYSSQLFSYGYSRRWKNLPDYINLLFTSRKNEINTEMEFSDATIAYFVKLNSRLTKHESLIHEFLNSLLLIYQENKLESVIEDFSYNDILMQFMTSAAFMNSPKKEGVAKWLRYELAVPINDWLAGSTAFYADSKTQEYDLFLGVLAEPLRKEKICYLFCYLGHHGLLALQDMLNIDTVSIKFQTLYRLKTI
ncbi:MAG: hypothetical protein ACOH2A_03605 [Sphingobacteriaceae bacterium]